MQSIQDDSIEVGRLLRSEADKSTSGVSVGLEQCIVINKLIWEAAHDYQTGVAQIVQKQGPKA